jgi:predicted Zn-dependent protease with MMP-like domain
MKADDETLENARLLYEDARFEEVLQLLEEDTSSQALYLSAAALYELGEHEEAESVCRTGLAAEELPELRSLEALLLLQRGDRQPAQSAALRALELDRDSPDAHYVHGLVLTQLRRIEDADAAFARAAELDPETYFRPYRLSAEEFDEAVDEALADLPEEFEAHLENVEIAIEEVPADSLVREGIEFDLLGLYQGGTIQADSFRFPDRILLFHRNLENISPAREELLEEIRDTVYHEIGHHMGMDEDTVREAEDARE